MNCVSCTVIVLGSGEISSIFEKISSLMQWSQLTEARFDWVELHGIINRKFSISFKLEKIH